MSPVEAVNSTRLDVDTVIVSSEMALPYPSPLTRRHLQLQCPV